MPRTDSAEILLGATVGTLVRWVRAKHALPGTAAGRFLGSPSVSTARSLVSSLDHVLHLYTTTVAEVVPEDSDVLEGILHLELGSVAASGWIGVTTSFSQDLSIALASKTRDFLKDLQASGRIATTLAISELRPSKSRHPIEVSADAIAYIAVAGLDQWAEEQRDRSYRQKLSELQALLGLKASELAAVLHVSREAVRQWFDGAPISRERWADIDRLARVVDFLTKYFKQESLPSIVRRRPPILGNRTPLELLAAGRHDEVVTAYQRLFAPGVTQ